MDEVTTRRVKQLVPQLPGEPARAYGALMAWVVTPPDERTLSGVARSAGTTRQSLARYRNDWSWDARVQPWDQANTAEQLRARAVQAAQREVVQGERERELERKAETVKAYAQRVEASANLCLTLALTIGQKLLDKLKRLTPQDLDKMSARDLAALLQLVPRLSEAGILALGELHGAHEYLEFLSQRDEETDPADPDEAEAG